MRFMELLNIKDVEIERLFNRSQLAMNEQAETVRSIIADIRARGDEALFEYTSRFDKTSLDASSIKVSKAEIEQAYENTDAELIRVMKESAANIRDYYARQKRESFTYNQKEGRELGVLYIPIQSLGVYVPGGAAAYPSSVLMSAVPAAVAGVERIIVATPCDASLKRPAYSTIVAADIAGVSEIYKMGGAQAIAALAFGTQSVQKVDKIVGPGNIYVALAKREVFGYVGIDSIAGPSEILVIADGSADARYVAADVLSQAEHDPMAACICVSCDKALAQEILREIEKQMEKLSRRDIISRSLSAYGAVVVADNPEQAVEFSNRIAPEHLELCVEKPEKLLPLIKNAGAVFMGHYSPEPLGDYFAGPSHVLPTSGTARFFSPVNLDDFVKKTSVINYSREALREVHKDIELFARFEGLTAHENSVKIRFEEE